MKNDLHAYLLDLATFGLMALLVLAGPVIASSQSVAPDPFREQLFELRQRLDLTPEQTRMVGDILEERRADLRHLRGQMLTTYTPDQQTLVKRLWRERSGSGPLLEEERVALRQQVGATHRQIDQLSAYEQLIDDHKQQTVRMLDDLLTSGQQERLRKSFSGLI